MSRFSGPQGRGAMKAHREKKRAEAEARAKRQPIIEEAAATRSVLLDVIAANPDRDFAFKFAQEDE